jgi:hypothetical protein
MIKMANKIVYADGKVKDQRDVGSLFATFEVSSEVSSPDPAFSSVAMVSPSSPELRNRVCAAQYIKVTLRLRYLSGRLSMVSSPGLGHTSRSAFDGASTRRLDVPFSPP